MGVTTLVTPSFFCLTVLSREKGIGQLTWGILAPKAYPHFTLRLAYAAQRLGWPPTACPPSARAAWQSTAAQSSIACAFHPGWTSLSLERPSHASCRIAAPLTDPMMLHALAVPTVSAQHKVRRNGPKQHFPLQSDEGTSSHRLLSSRSLFFLLSTVAFLRRQASVAACPSCSCIHHITGSSALGSMSKTETFLNSSESIALRSSRHGKETMRRGTGSSRTIVSKL